MRSQATMASWRKEIQTNPDLYDYKDSDFERPKIIGYFSVGENSEPIEDLSTLRYLSCEPKTINLDIKSGETEKSIKVPRLEPFFKYIASHKEIIQKCIGTAIEDAGFVFGRTTLSKIALALYSEWSSFILCAHLLRGVIYIYHDLETYDNYVYPDKLNQYFYRSVDSDPNVRKEKFVIVLETNLNQHNILYRSELVGLENSEEEISPNLEKDLVIDEINKRNIVELTISTIPRFTTKKAMRVWTKAFWGNVDKTLCGFTNKYGIVTEIESYNTRDLETIGKGEWREREILNFTGKLLTFIKDCFKDKFKSVDVKSANERLFFQKNEYESCIKLVDEVNFNNMNWIPDWYINNQSIP